MKNLANSPEGRDQATVIHGLTNLADHAERGPFLIADGDGVMVRDTEGREYIEGMAGLWCAALGYSEDRLVEAARRQMSILPYSHLTDHKGHLPVVELAETLLALAPVPMARVWFANSGSEANDSALRLAWYYWDALGQPERTKLISHDRAYHGNTAATASLSGTAYSQQGFNLPFPGFLKVTCPDYFRESEPGENEDAFASRLADNLDRQIQDEGPETIAAFFAEPVMGAGGVVVPPPGYYEKVQAVLKKYDILFVVDEVVTAFGRIGDMFGSTTMGLTPDLIVCAKALSSAYFPISAVLINQKIYDAMLVQSGRLGPFGLTMTYSGHPVGAAVASEALKIYQERDIVGHVRRMSPKFLGGLKSFADHELVADVRGLGLLAGVELKIDAENTTANVAAVGALCAQAAQSNGLLVRAIGNVIAFCPPLIIESAHIDELLSRFESALNETAATIS